MVKAWPSQVPQFELEHIHSRKTENQRRENCLSGEIVNSTTARFVVMIKAILQAKGGSLVDMSPNRAEEGVLVINQAEGQPIGKIVLAEIGDRKGIGRCKISFRINCISS